MNEQNPMTFTTPTDREIEITYVVEAPASLVFDAWTNPEHPPHWMLGPEGWTMPVCEIDLRPGGRWHFVWRNADGTEMEMNGEYREIVPGERIVNTENWGGEWPETVHTLIFDVQDGSTTITERILYPSKEARDAALGTGMMKGVERSMELLDDYLKAMA